MFALRRTPLILPKPNLPSRGIPLSQVRMSSSKPAATVESLDHLVLTVKSIPNTTEWYTTHLGMRSGSFVSDADPNTTRYSLTFGSQKINLHEIGKEFEPKALNIHPGSSDLCFITTNPIAQVRQRLISSGVEMVDLSPEKTADDGTVFRTGARGSLRSVYVRDPDGNLIEISNYV